MSQQPLCFAPEEAPRQEQSPLWVEPKPQPLRGTGRDKLFGLLFLLNHVFVLDGLLFTRLNLGFALSLMIFALLLWVYLSGKDRRSWGYSTLCGVLAIIGSGSFALHNDTATRLVCLVWMVLLLTLCGMDATKSGRFSTGSFRCGFDLIKQVVAYPFRFIGPAMAGLFGRSANKTAGGKVGKILLGALCALPVVGMVLPLMKRSNTLFDQLLMHLDWHPGRLFVCLLLGWLSLPLLFSVLYAWKKGLARSETKAAPLNGGIDPVAIYAFLTVLGVVDLVYLLTQTVYFFSAFGGRLPNADYATTMADYARRGFFELCAIAAIHLAVLFLTMLLVRKQQGKFSLGTRLLGLFLCLFNLMLIGTAFSKMAMYVQRFGLTRLRIVTCLFMVVLAVVFVCVMFRLMIRRFPYMKVLVIVCSVVVFATAFADLDTTIARYNVQAYQQGQLQQVDLDTLEQLSLGATPYLYQLTKDEDAAVAEEAHNALVRQVFRLYRVECYCEDGCDYEQAMGHTQGLRYCDYQCHGVKSVTPKKDCSGLSYNRDEAAARALLEEHMGELLLSYSR